MGDTGVTINTSCNRSAGGSSTTNPVRVCFLIDQLATGGTETQLLKLIENLDRRRVIPYLCLLNGDDLLSKQMEPQGCTVERLGVRSLRSPATLVSLLRFVLLLRRWKIDVLQSHFPDSTYFGITAGVLARTPRLVRTRRDLFYWTSRLHRKFGRKIDEFFNRHFVSAMITNSQACRQAALDTEQPPAKKIVVIDNAIDTSLFQRIQRNAPLHATNKTIRIGMVAMLREEKRVDLFVEAAAILKKQYPDVRYEVVGEGGMRPELEKRIKALALQGEFQLSGVSRDIPRFLASVDVAVLSSDSEGSSNALIEYMTAGRAIIATAVGGNSEAIEHRVTGILVPPNSAAALAEAMSDLLSNPKLALALGEQAYAVATRRYSLAAAARAHEDFYCNLMGTPLESKQAMKSTADRESARQLQTRIAGR